MRVRRTIVISFAVLGSGFLVVPSVHRVVVEGGSMVPALLDGDRLVLVGPSRWARLTGKRRSPVPGEIVALPDPRDPARILVKRLASIDWTTDTVVVLGDAAGASTDSRTFGPVARSSLLGRVTYRYAPPSRAGRGPWAGEYARA